ncbi:hypothetical protein CEXT_675141 [Caerostris extrusa]|uniref:Uncharacterized protein n=1 Tax=Caerostris extrusa TaxID=172846 RepID=A0AAV4T0V4_CAEEX|nr:hypothetical protein CEXT_675141 [Caerostris extrusa]
MASITPESSPGRQSIFYSPSRRASITLESSPGIESWLQLPLKVLLADNQSTIVLQAWLQLLLEVLLVDNLIYYRSSSVVSITPESSPLADNPIFYCPFLV